MGKLFFGGDNYGGDNTPIHDNHKPTLANPFPNATPLQGLDKLRYSKANFWRNSDMCLERSSRTIYVIVNRVTLAISEPAYEMYAEMDVITYTSDGKSFGVMDETEFLKQFTLVGENNE